MKKLLLVVFITVIPFRFLNAEESTISGVFSNIIGGARASVFGKSFVAVNTPELLDANPAALVNWCSLSVTATHTNLYSYEKLYYDGIGIFYWDLPFWLPKGLTYRRLSLGGMLTTDDYGNILSGNATYSENTITLIFSYYLFSNFSIGISPKLHIVDGFDPAFGYGMDVGLFSSSIFSFDLLGGKFNTTIGIVFNNAVSNINYQNGFVEKVPKKIDLGFSLDSKNFTFAASISPYISVACEYKWDLTHLRVGYEIKDEESILKLGVGFVIPQFSLSLPLFDYGFENHKSLENTHRFSVAYHYDLQAKITIPNVPLGSQIYVNGEIYKMCTVKDSPQLLLKPGEYKIKIIGKDKSLIGMTKEPIKVGSCEQKDVEIVNDAIMFYSKGIESFELREYDKAKELFERATQLDPYLADGWYQLGRCYEILGKIDDCINAWNKALQIKFTEYKFLQEIIKDLK